MDGTNGTSPGYPDPDPWRDLPPLSGPCGRTDPRGPTRSLPDYNPIDCAAYWIFCVFRIKTYVYETSSISLNLKLGLDFSIALALSILFLPVLNFLINISSNSSPSYFFKIFKSGELISRNVKTAFSIISFRLG